MFKLISQSLTKTLIVLLLIYKKALSPLIHGLFGLTACRFQPTCSENMILSLRKHGLTKGFSLGLSQFFKCHPFYHPISH